ncbi:2-isopropylmalate synthase [Seonamhaeicola sp. MEBiC1930]|uniref:alpha-isopropylmalate synthase regulatory domain-containing protein n=1 Tax=Seonamhaeicola sp. MEBiC01930 TaxID=2976768 RepID=UPI0032566990
MGKRRIEIMDTTLRDGEQTSTVSFSASEKLTIAKLLLEELKVDRIEIASARVSEGEFQAVKDITNWAAVHDYIDKVEVLTFVDKGVSINWMLEAGAKVQNLLTKGSLNHLTHQLKKTPNQHFKEIEENILLASKNNIETNIYLEDWSNGMRDSKDYVLEFIKFLSTQQVKRIMLPDTLGVLTPRESFDFVKEIKDLYPNLHFDFHAHNDYDLSVSNVMEALKAGADGLHLTVNGMGERAGNAPMASTIAVVNDFMSNDIIIAVNEKVLFSVSKLVENFSGVMIPANKPIVGANVFTQTAGIHADGDNKKNLYFSDLLPERFGRKRQYALGKSSGKANIQKNLQQLGLQLNDDEIKKVTQRIIELGDKKQVVTKEDLPYIISDVLDQSYEEKVKVNSYVLTHSKGLKPSTTVSIIIEGETFEENAQGDGQFDAFMNAIKNAFKKKKTTLPNLIDYAVRIPPGSNSDALCETIITWKTPDKEFKTRGLDSDQTVSAIKATEKMLNIIIN